MLNTESEREAARILAKIGATSADPEIRAKLEAAERRGRRQSREDKQSSG